MGPSLPLVIILAAASWAADAKPVSTIVLSSGRVIETSATVESDGSDASALVVAAQTPGPAPQRLEASLTRDAEGRYKVSAVRVREQNKDLPEGSKLPEPPAFKIEDSSLSPSSDGTSMILRLARKAAGNGESPSSAVLVFKLPAPSQDSAEPEARRLARLKSMSLGEKIGTLLMKPLGPDDLDAHADDIVSGRLGGALLKWDKFTPEQAREFSERTQKMRGASLQKPDFLISADHEGGPLFTQGKLGARSPGNMALGAAGSPELSGSAARSAGRELAAAGVHINFGPVADANTNPNNPIIGLRSFGEDPQKVAEHVAAAVRGYSEGGVVAVPKHFPGHGDTEKDSHTSLPVVRKSVSELEKAEFVAFRAAIDAGAQSIMTAHILFPSLDEEYPATLSKKVIGYLREKMGFNGVLVSDSMDMEAISKRYGAVDASVRALDAGVDILLIGKQDSREIHRGITEAAESGRLPISRLDEAVLRVLRMKDSIGERRVPEIKDLDRSAAERQADEIAERAVTLVRDPRGLIPLKLGSETKAALIAIHNGNFAAPLTELADQIRRRHSNLSVLMIGQVRPKPEDAESALALARETDLLIIGTFGWGTAEYVEQTRLVEAVASLGKPVVIVSLMNPYDARYVPPTATVLSAYGLTQPAMRAVARVIFGEIPAKGRSPVTIPGGPVQL